MLFMVNFIYPFVEIPPDVDLDPVGQIVEVRKTDNGAFFGFLVTHTAQKKRYFWHSSDCDEVPQKGDIVQFRPTLARRAGECPRARSVRITARVQSE